MKQFLRSPRRIAFLLILCVLLGYGYANRYYIYFFFVPIDLETHAQINAVTAPDTVDFAALEYAHDWFNALALDEFLRDLQLKKDAFETQAQFEARQDAAYRNAKYEGLPFDSVFLVTQFQPFTAKNYNAESGAFDMDVDASPIIFRTESWSNNVHFVDTWDMQWTNYAAFCGEARSAKCHVHLSIAGPVAKQLVAEPPSLGLVYAMRLKPPYYVMERNRPDNGIISHYTLHAELLGVYAINTKDKTILQQIR